MKGDQAEGKTCKIVWAGWSVALGWKFGRVQAQIRAVRG